VQGLSPIHKGYKSTYVRVVLIAQQRILSDLAGHAQLLFFSSSPSIFDQQLSHRTSYYWFFFFIYLLPHLINRPNHRPPSIEAPTPDHETRSSFTVHSKKFFVVLMQRTVAFSFAVTVKNQDSIWNRNAPSTKQTALAREVGFWACICPNPNPWDLSLDPSPHLGSRTHQGKHLPLVTLSDRYL
jgi:hypothetical protein